MRLRVCMRERGPLAAQNWGIGRGKRENLPQLLTATQSPPSADQERAGTLRSWPSVTRGITTAPGLAQQHFVIQDKATTVGNKFSWKDRAPNVHL